MSGEINGTTVIVKKGGSEIVGQMEMTVTLNGTPIDISNKSSGDNVTLLDGQLSGQQLQFSGTLVYNSDTIYRAVRADSLIGTQAVYSIEYVSNATTDESFSATMVPTGLSDAVPHGDKVATSITFVSSGVITHTPAVT